MMFRPTILAALCVCLSAARLKQRKNYHNSINQQATATQSTQQANTKQQAKKKPHILFILADDLGYNQLGFRQNTQKWFSGTESKTTLHDSRTPTIDRLAKESVILDRYYVQSLCTPSRAALMTGRFPFRFGMAPEVINSEHTYGLPASEWTLAEMLSSAGYATHMIGKWHLGHADHRFTPTFRGFQSFSGYLTSHQDYFTHSQHGAVDFQETPVSENFMNKVAPHTNKYMFKYSTDVFAKRAQAILKQHEQHNHSQPLFLYFALQSVHTGIPGGYNSAAPKKYLEMYSNIEEPHKTALAMTQAMDDAVKDVVDAFKRQGMWDDTVLIFSTDNGGVGEHEKSPGGTNFPLRGVKFSDFEGGIRGVSFARGSSSWPISGGSSTSALMHITDWFPTIAHLAGVQDLGKYKLDGQNIWNLLKDPTCSQSDRTIAVNVPTNEASLQEQALKPIFAASIIHGSMKLMIASSDDLSFANPAYAKQVPMAGFSPPAELMCDSPAPFTFDYKTPKYEYNRGQLHVFLFDTLHDPRECYNLAESDASKVEDLLGRLEDYQQHAGLKLYQYAKDNCQHFNYTLATVENDRLLVSSRQDHQECGEESHQVSRTLVCNFWPYKEEFPDNYPDDQNCRYPSR